MSTLNDDAAELCDRLAAQADRLRVTETQLASGTRLLDFGVRAVGGLEAGLALAQVCLANAARVELVPAANDELARASLGLSVVVTSDRPVQACMASQYAGWEVTGENYFAMGSGPMRAAAAREPLVQELDVAEQPQRCVGVLETNQLPPDDVAAELARKCGVAPDRLTLLAARTKSLAGTLQVVARSLETALHKLHELKFPLAAVASGCGVAPLPPPAADDLQSIGRTNDAILYGGHVVLYVRTEDEAIEAIGAQLPSSASRDYGRPFADLLQSYGGDFYRVDPLLFSPAQATLVNLNTGRTFHYGQMNAEILRASFLG